MPSSTLFSNTLMFTLLWVIVLVAAVALVAALVVAAALVALWFLAVVFACRYLSFTFTKFFFMAKHLDDLRERRLNNLDAAIVYYGKRLNSLKSSKAKIPSLNIDEYSLTETEAYDLRIKDLEDFISYLKLC